FCYCGYLPISMQARQRNCRSYPQYTPKTWPATQFKRDKSSLAKFSRLERGHIDEKHNCS
ncbi:hypothetical protein, partial [Erwinia amylovora]|uniref:hypothetical protein n=1 Tax=Erwinia amylovora TaxID=552 RepID=UPI0020BE3032